MYDFYGCNGSIGNDVTNFNIHPQPEIDSTALLLCWDEVSNIDLTELDILISPFYDVTWWDGNPIQGGEEIKFPIQGQTCTKSFSCGHRLRMIIVKIRFRFLLQYSHYLNSIPYHRSMFARAMRLSCKTSCSLMQVIAWQHIHSMQDFLRIQPICLILVLYSCRFHNDLCACYCRHMSRYTTDHDQCRRLS